MVEELVELIRDGRRLSILDVGGHSGLIADFLPEDDTFILDIQPFEGPNCTQGDGAWLPFEDDSFDLVVSVDTLEHIPPDRRARFLQEQLRTSRDYVLLTAPFEDENIALAEQIVNDFFIRKVGRPNHSLEEHFASGLPGLDETLSFFDQSGLQHLEIPNGYLYNWLVMMIALLEIQALPDSEEPAAMINRFYNQNLYVSDNRRPCYRTVILASKQHSLDRDSIISKYEKVEGDDQVGTNLKLANLLLNLKLVEPRIAALKDELEEQTEWALKLRNELEKKDAYINKLQREFEERTEWALRLREEIEDKDRRIVELRDEFDERTEWAKTVDYELRKKLEERMEWVLKLQQESDERGRRIVELQDELEEQKTWALGLRDRLKERTEWAIELKDDHEKRKEHFEKLQEEFEERTKWALQLQNEAAEKDRRILSLRDELEVQTQWALQLLEELEQKDGYLKRLQSEFEERTQWALQLNEELTRIRQSWYYRLFGKLEIRG